MNETKEELLKKKKEAQDEEEREKAKRILDSMDRYQQQLQDELQDYRFEKKHGFRRY